MLSDSSYMTAVYAYCGAALVMVLCLTWWVGFRWRNGWSALLVLLAAALLLTPAYPREGVDTLAPALIVAGFQFATEGMEAAEHALRPLAVSCAVAVVLALLLRLTLLRKRKPEPKVAAASPAAAEGESA